MKRFVVTDAAWTPKFSVGEIVAKCYVQKWKFVGVMYYSLSSGEQQVVYDEDLEEIDGRRHN